MHITHVIAVIDEESGHEALYVDGELFEQDSTIYACDIAKAAKGKVIQFSQVRLNLPESEVGFPSQFEKCMLWNPVSTVPE